MKGAEMDDRLKKDPEETAPADISRRQFVSGVGVIGLGAMIGGLFVKGLLLPDKVLAIPASQGYLLVDTKK